MLIGHTQALLAVDAMPCVLVGLQKLSASLPSVSADTLTPPHMVIVNAGCCA